MFQDGVSGAKPPTSHSFFHPQKNCSKLVPLLCIAKNIRIISQAVQRLFLRCFTQLGFQIPDSYRGQFRGFWVLKNWFFLMRGPP